jgi:hypothetical protein
MKHIATFVGLAALATSAQAQFLTGITKPVFGVNPPNAFLTDLNAGTNTLLYDIESLGIPATAPGWGGLAGDDANRRFFASVRNGPTDDIYQFNYSDPTAPIFVTRTQSEAGGNFAIDGLAFDSRRGVMYGSNALGTSGNAEGLHTIDLTTGVLTTVVDFATLPGGISGYNVTGIDYDADTDLVYLVDEQLAGGRWIYTFDPKNPSAGLAELALLPDGVTDIDGLGAGGGQLFLVTDNASANGGNHYVYDLATGTYSTFASPYPAPAGSPIAPNPSGAGAYVPGLIPAPGTLLVLAGMAPFMRRRR